MTQDEQTLTLLTQILRSQSQIHALTKDLREERDMAAVADLGLTVDVGFIA